MGAQYLINQDHKVFVGFKCNPSLKLALCEQAEKMGVTLSSHVETIVSTYKNNETDVKDMSGQVRSMQERIDFYENAFLKELYKKYKGQSIQFRNREGEKVTITIRNITDVYTIIINSFTIDK